VLKISFADHGYFPQVNLEKLGFENNSYQTTRINKVIRWICTSAKGYRGFKTRKALNIQSLPG
jgi:hypothetical protein